VSLSLDRRAALDFALTLRGRWADTLYPRLAAEHAAASDDAAEPQDVRTLPSYGGFAWLDRGSQKMLWRAAVAASAADSNDGLEPPASGPATLELDPQLRLPSWYTEWDIHLQPGGVWSSPAAARVSELGARLVMPADNDDYHLHRLFVETAIPRRAYRRIVDLGCGFGKSTWPLKRHFPEAYVIGVDLARSCLELAATRASEQGLAMRLRQADAAATGLVPGSADLVTASMLIHELPLQHLAATLREAARLLAPGGLLRILDVHLTGEPLLDQALHEHGVRNNEPFMSPMLAADTAAMAKAAGLTDVRWRAFDEQGAGALPGLTWPSRPEWHYPWAVLEARKAAA
jgi:ubiquinone/menaquinone biosynthesis C-methylase UbiE